MREGIDGERVSAIPCSRDRVCFKNAHKRLTVCWFTAKRCQGRIHGLKGGYESWQARGTRCRRRRGVGVGSGCPPSPPMEGFGVGAMSSTPSRLQ